MAGEIEHVVGGVTRRLGGLDPCRDVGAGRARPVAQSNRPGRTSKGKQARVATAGPELEIVHADAVGPGAELQGMRRRAVAGAEAAGADEQLFSREDVRAVGETENGTIRRGLVTLSSDDDAEGGVQIGRSKTSEIQGGADVLGAARDIRQVDLIRLHDERTPAGHGEERDGAVRRARQIKITVDPQGATRGDGDDGSRRAVGTGLEARKRDIPVTEIDGGRARPGAEREEGAVRNRPRGRRHDGASEDRSRSLIAGGGTQREDAGPTLGEAAGAGAEAAGEREVRRVLDRSATRQDGDRSVDDGLREAGGQAERAAREDEVADVAADRGERGDLQGAFVEHRGESAAAGRIGAGKDERAAAGLHERALAGERRGDREGERRRGRRGGRIDDREDILGGGGTEPDAAVEAAEGHRVGRRSGGGRIKREQEGPTGVDQRLAGAAARDGDGRGGGTAIVDDQRVQRTSGETGEAGRQRFADVRSGAAGGVGRVFRAVDERAEAASGDVGHERVAHVGDGDLRRGQRLADGPGHDAHRRRARGAAGAELGGRHEAGLGGGIADAEVVTSGGVGGQAERAAHHDGGGVIAALERGGEHRSLGAGATASPAGEIVRAGTEDQRSDGLVGARVLVRADRKPAELRLTTPGSIGGIEDDVRSIAYAIAGASAAGVIEEHRASAADLDRRSADAAAAGKLEQTAGRDDRTEEVEVDGVEVQVARSGQTQDAVTGEGAGEIAVRGLADGERGTGGDLDDAVVGVGRDAPAGERADRLGLQDAQAGVGAVADHQRGRIGDRPAAGELDGAGMQDQGRGYVAARETQDAVPRLGQGLSRGDARGDLEGLRRILEDDELIGGGAQEAAGQRRRDGGHAVGDQQATAGERERRSGELIEGRPRGGVEAQAADREGLRRTGETRARVRHMRAGGPGGSIVGDGRGESDDRTGIDAGERRDASGLGGGESRRAEQPVRGVDGGRGQAGASRIVIAEGTLTGATGEGGGGQSEGLAGAGRERESVLPASGQGEFADALGGGGGGIAEQFEVAALQVQFRSRPELGIIVARVVETERAFGDDGVAGRSQSAVVAGQGDEAGTPLVNGCGASGGEGCSNGASIKVDIPTGDSEETGTVDVAGAKDRALAEDEARGSERIRAHIQRSGRAVGVL